MTINTNTLKQILIFTTSLIVLLSLAMRHHNVETLNENITQKGDNTFVVNTTEIGKDISGFAGNVPVEIEIADNIVSKVSALPNAETPDFFNRASQLLHSWDGLTLDQAIEKQVDAVSGATYSSRAIIANVHKGLELAASSLDSDKSNIVSLSQPPHLTTTDNSAMKWLSLTVLIMAMILPLIWKNKIYRIFQLVLNVAILGFWSCTFVNYTMLVSLATNGLDLSMSLLPPLMIIAAFVYPLFNKKNYYCTNICPLGSAQELTAKLPVKKIAIKTTIAKRLTLFREILWLTLMILLAFGIWSEWIGYEPFTAFAIEIVPFGMIVFAVTILITSIFVPRAYCRFVCPTGTLLKSVPTIYKPKK
ncbi:MAG: 4Fe-4S binding protein [Bacteroidaceae bacterium]